MPSFFTAPALAPLSHKSGTLLLLPPLSFLSPLQLFSIPTLISVPKASVTFDTAVFSLLTVGSLGWPHYTRRVCWPGGGPGEPPCQRRGTGAGKCPLTAQHPPTLSLRDPPEPTAGPDQLCVDKTRFEMHRKETLGLWIGDTLESPAGGPGLLSQATLNNFPFTVGFSEGGCPGAGADPLPAVPTPGTLHRDVPHPGHTITTPTAFTYPSGWWAL